MNDKLDDNYWSSRYLKKETGWDIGNPSGPLTAFIDTLTDPDIRILIPGCGNAYEAEYLLKKGFRHITLVDISTEATRRLREKFLNTPVCIIHQDFFDHEGQYDLILEQTFFCALYPSFRKKYAGKMAELLRDGGRVAGVLFNQAFEGGPPFGGNTDEYHALFTPYFKTIRISPCYNSIPQREGTEVFIILKKEAV